MENNEALATFKVGETYTTRSVCDHDCVLTYTVLRRTAKFITVTGGFGRDTVRRVKVHTYVDRNRNTEVASPDGTYSMSPVIFATK